MWVFKGEHDPVVRKSSTILFMTVLYSFVIMFLCSLPDYGGSSPMKYQTFNPSYSSKSSYVYSGSKTMVSTTELFTHIL